MGGGLIHSWFCSFKWLSLCSDVARTNPSWKDLRLGNAHAPARAHHKHTDTHTHARAIDATLRLVVMSFLVRLVKADPLAVQA